MAAKKSDIIFEKKPSKSRKSHRRRHKAGLAAGIIGGIVILAAVGGYLGLSVYFNNHFYPKSAINGVNVGRKSLDGAKETLATAANTYLLTITARDGTQYRLDGADFGYEFTENGSAEEFLESQNGYAWISQAFREHNYEITTSTSYDEDKLISAAKELDCFDESRATPPSDAQIVKKDGKISVVSETQGNTLIVDKAVDLIVDAVSKGETDLILGDECYEKPQITADSEEIVAVMQEVEKYCSTSITYTIGDETQVLDSDTISSWVDIDKDNNITIDESKVADYAQLLATKYNTYGDKRQFKTSEGDVIEIGGGDYGWVVDKPNEAKQIIEDIRTGGDITREPVYQQVAKIPGADDIGDTYIEIDYTNQHLYYYKEGKLVMDSDIVSGNIKNGNGSPDGVYKIIYKQSPATLVGENYSSNVTYFMVFAYNVGIHDATWRSSFGGEIYKGNGSHGCINVPASFAKELYAVLETDTPVVAYYRESVTLTAENARISNAYSYKK